MSHHDAHDTGESRDAQVREWSRRAAAILLAGGRGTRLASVRGDLPKPLIPCAGRAFIEWVIDQVAASGITRIAVSAGHLAHITECHVRDHKPDYDARGLEVGVITEDAPLGTGGAIAMVWDRLTEELGHRPPILAANADSLVLASLDGMLAALNDPDLPVDAALLAVGVDDVRRYGSVEISDDARLIGFREKSDADRASRGWINAGVYAFAPSARDAFPGEPGQPPRASSLERDVLPGLIERERIVAADRVQAPFIDIGTPESLARAEAWISQHLHRKGTRPPISGARAWPDATGNTP